MHDTVDLAIVGGGIIGTMVAVAARRSHPDWAIALLDRSLIGHGATLHSAFAAPQLGPGTVKRQLARRSAELFRQLRERLPDLPLVDLPMVAICAQATLPEALTALAAPPSEIATASVAGDELSRQLPGFAVPDSMLVLRGLSAMRCTDYRLTTQLAKSFADSARSTCLEGFDVRRVTAGSGGELCLETHDGRRLHARRVAACLGPWFAARIPGLAPSREQLRVKKVAAIHLPLRPAEGAPLIYLCDHEAFLLPQPEQQRWLLSFRSEDWDCAPNVSELHLSSSDWQRVREICSIYFQVLPDALGARVFCDGYTASGDPLLAWSTELPGCLLAGGCSGSGFRLAPAIAERAIELLNEQRTTEHAPTSTSQ